MGLAVVFAEAAVGRSGTVNQLRLWLSRFVLRRPTVRLRAAGFDLGVNGQIIKVHQFVGAAKTRMEKVQCSPDGFVHHL